MKTFLALAVLTLSLLASHAQYVLNEDNSSLTVGTTNTYTVDVTRTTGVTLQASFTGGGGHTTAAAVTVTNSANATNGQTFSVILGAVTNVYTWTNAAAASLRQIQSTNTAANAATNLFTKLSADYAGVLVVTYSSATALKLLTIDNPGFAVEQSGVWGEQTITTNALTGNVYFKATRSVDKLLWFRSAANDFTIPYSTTTQVSHLTNFTSLGGGFYRWTAENAETNYANANALNFKAAVKNGL